MREVSIRHLSGVYGGAATPMQGLVNLGNGTASRVMLMSAPEGGALPAGTLIGKMFGDPIPMPQQGQQQQLASGQPQLDPSQAGQSQGWGFPQWGQSGSWGGWGGWQSQFSQWT